jgi:hypothetical protein
MSGFDILTLGSFVTAGKENHEFVSVLTEVNPVSGTEINLKLHDVFADGFAITHIAHLNTPDTSIDLIASRFISQREEPVPEGLFAIGRFVVLDFSLLSFHAFLV